MSALIRGDAAGPDTLILALNEDAWQGDTEFTLSVNGVQVGGTQTVTALRTEGQTQNFTLSGKFSSGVQTVTVDFLNDAYGGSEAQDRNLYVTGATLNGSTIEGSQLTEYSDGPQSFSFNGTSAAANPSPIDVAVNTTSAGPDTLILALNEDAWQGDTEFTLSVNGVQVGGTQTVTALRTEGQTQNFTLSGKFSSGVQTVTVDFLNDAYGGSEAQDRNLYVTGATLNGSTIEGSQLTEYSDGPQSFSFNGTSAAATPSPVDVAVNTTSAGPDTLILALNEDAWQGDTEFTLSVNGVQVGGTQTVTALRTEGQTQNFTLSGKFSSGVQTVTVDFLNDAYGGSEAQDRNLYVTGATLNGSTIEGSQLTEYSGGPQSFSFNATATSNQAISALPGTASYDAHGKLVSLTLLQQDAELLFPGNGGIITGPASQTGGAGFSSAAPVMPSVSSALTISAQPEWSTASTETMSGTARPNTTAFLLDTSGGMTAIIGAVEADAAGNWSMTGVPLTPGINTLTLVGAGLASGAVASSASVNIVAASTGSNTQSAGNDTGGVAGRDGSLLPAGFLSTDGSQIVDQNGNAVRIASIGWGGTDSSIYAPWGLWQSSIAQNIGAIKADGFNTIRIPWTDAMLSNSPRFDSAFAAFNPALDPELVGKTSLQLLQILVADAGNAGLKVILDHHDNDGGPDGYGGQQANGLWFDSGPGTDGTDGSGTAGTVTAGKFLADSVQIATTFAGNSSVIGFDLENEPTAAGNINWGQGGPTDIHAMYTQVGDAIQAVDPGALIIAEGPEEWNGPTASMPAGFAEGDLSGVAIDPVTLTIANKIVYSVHEYPPDLSGNGSYTAAQQIATMNAGWGYLETNNIAPVWVGEIGSNMTSAADQRWIQTLLDYMNGRDGSQGGPTFSGNEQAVSASWWQWGSAGGQDPQGVETAWGSGAYWPAQQVATDQLLYSPTGAASTSAITAGNSATSDLAFLSPPSGSVLLSAAEPVLGAPFIATVSNLGAAPSNGWAAELDTTDVLQGLAGALVNQAAPGVYIVTPTSADSYLASGGYTSFAVKTSTLGSDTMITAHLLA